MNDDFPRIKRLPPYVFNIVNDLKAEARARGEDIIDFGMGNPDKPAPQHIIDKLTEAAQRPDTHRYSVSRGIPRLRKAVCDWYQRKFDVDLDPETETIVTIGSKEGLAHLALATVGPGDAILVPNPAYPIHPYGFVISGADIRHVPLIPGGDFFAELEKSMKDTWPKPKMLVLNFPGNPTTQCVELEFFERVVAFAKEHKIWVVHDLAYGEITFDGYKAPSILEVPGAKDVAVEFYTLSKTYNMPGWRVGFMSGNPTLVSALARMKSYLDYGMFTPIQVAAIAALDGPQDCVDEIVETYKSRRDVLCDGLNSIGWEVEKPKATMFVWAKIPEKYREMGSLEFTKKLLREAKVAVSPGIGFGEYGDDHVRFGLIENEHRTRQAVRGIRDMFRKRLGDKVQSVKIGVLGLGTVGSGTVNVLQRNIKDITRRAGRDIDITHAAVRDLNSETQCSTDGINVTDNAMELVNNPDIQVIVELIGGTGIAHELVLQAIENGKHVVTANKALIAIHGNELFAKAQEKGVTIAFEAAVAGGIPIIKAMREGLAANQIEWLAGIINGTGNFILTEMRDKGRDFPDVLAEAQALGYAEADPTFDVEGIDAAHKLTIMASIAFGIPLQFDKAYTEGISQISQDDVKFAAELGYRIKHLGIAKKTELGVELRVHPTMIPHRRLIANVDGVMNAVLVQGDAVGPTLYYGAGAGSEATASAVVADIVDIVRTLTTDPENRVPHLAFQPDTLKDTPILPIADVVTSYYLRVHTEDKPGVLADITSILSNKGISIEAVLQKQAENGGSVPVIMLTHEVAEKNMNEAIAEIEALSSVNDKVMRIRMESLG